jgi:transcriptional regulator with XRE-family HTH domain
MRRTTPVPSSCCPDYRRRYWAELFAYAIRQERQDMGLSVEDIARLAGMEASEWAAIEAGHVPTRVDQLRSMAGALEVRYDRLLLLVLYCRDAWER